MKKTAIIFSSTDGHTAKICKKITDILQHASMVSLSSIEEADSLELENFDFIIIGASTVSYTHLTLPTKRIV